MTDEKRGFIVMTESTDGNDLICWATHETENGAACALVNLEIARLGLDHVIVDVSEDVAQLRVSSG